MDFVTLSIQCNQELIDVLIAELFELGFDSFQEFEHGFEGSCPFEQYDIASVQQIFSKYSNATFTEKPQEKINWNEEWEKNYDPIIIENQCLVRATFHQPDKEFEYEIVINPKMSFGTGHHATTYQMLAHQITIDHQGKSVLDVGCGTGVLSIMASKRGASEILATDIDDWCIENSRENFSLNNVEAMLLQTQIEGVEKHNFDIILANINKNVLLDQMAEYAQRLTTNGQLLLSGFYKKDVNDIKNEALKHGLQPVAETEKDDWAMIALENNP